MEKKSTRGKSAGSASSESQDHKLDDRVRRSRATVLSATAELLFERGFAGTSVDEVSRRSGVAKTTIYRHWPTRADLLRDACSNIGTPMEVPDVGTYEADVTALLMNLCHLLRSAKWTSVLPSVIDAAERDPEIARMYSKLQEGYSAPLRFVIQRAIQRGELAKTTDIDVVIAALTGPLFYRRWFSREPLTQSFLKQIIRRVLCLDEKIAATGPGIGETSIQNDTTALNPPTSWPLPRGRNDSHLGSQRASRRRRLGPG